MRDVFENSIEIWRNINLKCSKCDSVGAVKLYTSALVQLLFFRGIAIFWKKLSESTRNIIAVSWLRLKFEKQPLLSADFDQTWNNI